MGFPFYTIGHSTRSIEDFVGLLGVGNVGLVVDIRTVRGSRRNPQYNEDSLAASLRAYGVDYCAIPELGGLRPRSVVTPPYVNAFWTNESFHNYADYALTESFRTGMDVLVAAGRQERCAVMCSEAVWWRCHRRIVADHLIHSGEKVFHLLGRDRVEEAVMTSGAKACRSGLLHYPRAGDT